MRLLATGLRNHQPIYNPRTCHSTLQHRNLSAHIQVMFLIFDSET